MYLIMTSVRSPHFPWTQLCICTVGLRWPLWQGCREDCRRWCGWRAQAVGFHTIINTKKADSAFSEATENTTNLAWLNEGENF